MAHHPEEFGSEPLHILQECQALNGDDEGLDSTLLRPDGGVLKRAVTLRPSGTLMTIYSARTVSPALSAAAQRQSLRAKLSPVGAPDGLNSEHLLRG